MRFLVDESTGPAVAEWLRENGHEVFSVFNEARGMQDVDIIQKAFTDNWILVTNDKDFGEKVYRERQPHRGVVLLRLEDERAIREDRDYEAVIGELCRQPAGEFCSRY